MKTPEYPNFDEFDILTASLEIEMVTDELSVMELVVRSYPNLDRIFRKNEYDLLESPTTRFAQNEETRILTKKNLPALARVLYDDESID